MKSITSIFFAISIVAMSFGVHAQDVSHRAFVFNEDNSCFVDSPETGLLIGSLHAVGVYAGGPFPGNGKATCQGNHDLELDQPIVFKGTVCNTFGFLTDDTLFIATPGGRWSYHCNFPKAE